MLQALPGAKKGAEGFMHAVVPAVMRTFKVLVALKDAWLFHGKFIQKK